MDWADIKNKYSLPYHYDTLRKAAQTPFGGADVSEYFKGKAYTNNSNNYMNELHVQKRELERAKIQFRDERNAWNKQNYIEARIEENLDRLGDELKSIGKIIYPSLNVCNISSNNDMLVILSDLHIGACYSSSFGEYNSDIAQIRLHKLLNEIVEIQKLYNAENCFIVLQGDLISSNIHLSIQVSNREDVITQVKMASEMIAGFCYQVSSHFSNVFLHDVSGNHSRIAPKDQAVHSERLDSLISWSIGNILSYVDNFTVCEDKPDIGIAEFNIRGKNYVAVHGDMDAFSKTGVYNLSTMLNYIPYAVTFGHRHFPASSEANGIKMVQGGNLGGSGDDYTIEKRLYGQPNQTVMVCSSNGIKARFDIDLS